MRRVLPLLLVIPLFACLTPAPSPPNTSASEGGIIKVLKAENPKEPFVVRGFCSLDSLYVFDFRDAKETHYSISVVQQNPFERISVYVPRDSDMGRRFHALLNDGQRHLMTLRCKFGQSVAVAECLAIVQDF